MFVTYMPLQCILFKHIMCAGHIPATSSMKFEACPWILNYNKNESKFVVENIADTIHYYSR